MGEIDSILSEIEQLQQARKALALTAYTGGAYNDNVDGSLDMLKKKEYEKKRQLVELKHIGKNGKLLAISKIQYRKRGKEQIMWTTRAVWKGDGAKLMKPSEEEIIDELFKHYYLEASKDITVKEVYKLWLIERESNKRISSLTVEHNKADWERYWAGRPLTDKEIRAGKEQFDRSSILDMKIKDVKVRDIRKRYEELTGDGRITKRTFNNLRSVINGVFAYAYDHDIPCIDASRVSCTGLYFKEEEDHSELVYTKEEVDKLLSYLEGLREQNRYTLAIRLMFSICCRIGELRALKWEDYFPETDYGPVIKLRHQIVDKAGDNQKRVPTDVAYMKGHSRKGKRDCVIPPSAVEVLEELRRINDQSEYICAGVSGDMSISTNTFNRYLKRYCEEAGVRYLSSHKIRFYTVSKMYDEEINENDIMYLAGHSNLSTTRHYNRKIREIKLSSEQVESCFGRPLKRA